MNDSEDILNKADALLERYRGAARDAADPDQDVPLLTEVVETGDLLERELAEFEPAVPVAVVEPDDLPGRVELEQRVIAKVSDAVAGIVDAKLAKAAADLRHEVQAIVERAVRDTLNSTQSQDVDQAR